MIANTNITADSCFFLNPSHPRMAAKLFCSTRNFSNAVVSCRVYVQSYMVKKTHQTTRCIDNRPDAGSRVRKMLLQTAMRRRARRSGGYGAELPGLGWLPLRGPFKFQSSQHVRERVRDAVTYGAILNEFTTAFLVSNVFTNPWKSIIDANPQSINGRLQLCLSVTSLSVSL